MLGDWRRGRRRHVGGVQLSDRAVGAHRKRERVIGAEEVRQPLPGVSQTDAEATAQARIPVFGLFVWLASSWIVAARFVVRGMAPPERRDDRVEVADPSRVMVAHPLIIAADATRRRPEFQPHSA